MDQVLQLAFDGVVIGMLYAVVGLGIVVVFRTTNVLNFSQGAVATAAGYLAWTLTDGLGLNYAGALILATLVGAVMGILIGALVTYGLSEASPLTKSVATLGAFLVIGWGAREIWGDVGRTLPRPFDGTVEIGGVFVGGHSIFVVVVAAAALALTFLLLERTRLGLGMRALAQDRPTARSHGVSLAVTTLAAWGMASALGAASGVLVGSFIQVDHSVMTTTLIHSIAALVVGGFGSASGAVVGGLALGVSSSLIAGLASPGYKDTFVFAIILLILVVRPNGLVGRATVTVHESGDDEEENHPALPRPGSWRRPGRLGWAIALVVAVVALPFLPHPFSLLSYSVTLATTIAVISLSFFMGFVGEISLGHGALVTVGGYTTAILLDQWAGLPFLPVLLISAVAAAIVGGLLGVITLRLSGVYLAIATLALSFVVIEVALQLSDLTGGAGGLGVPDPTILGSVTLTSDQSVYYLTAAILGVVALAVAALIRSPIGQRWVAVRDAPVAAESNGVSVSGYKIAGFALSSAIAGIAGSLLAVVVTFISPPDYGLFFSIFIVLAVILGGSGSLTGALLGAGFISLMPVALSRTSGLTDAVFGLALLVLLIALPGGFRQLTAWLADDAPMVPAPPTKAPEPAAAHPRTGGSDQERSDALRP